MFWQRMARCCCYDAKEQSGDKDVTTNYSGRQVVEGGEKGRRAKFYVSSEDRKELDKRIVINAGSYVDIPALDSQPKS